MVLGNKRVDLAVEWEGRKYPIEIKILRGKKTVPDGVAQLLEYMNICDSDTGWLVVFDRSPKKFWGRKTYMKDVKTGGKRVTVVGC
jgi:hypothetical protein